MVITVTYNPGKDADNHVRAIFDSAYLAHGREDMKGKLLADVELDAVRNVLSSGKDGKEVKLKVEELLANAPGRTLLEIKAQKLEAAWLKLGNQIIFQLEMIYGREWPFETVHIDLTTLPLCPYNFKGRQIFVYGLTGTQTQLRILMHELNHFMFYWFYAKDLSTKLNQENLELLKESLTIFTNPEHDGKPNEMPLRKIYIDKHIRSIDEAIREGVNYLISQS